MIKKEKIIEVAESYVKMMASKSGIDLIIIHKHTIEKTYGSIFTYGSKIFHETGDFQYAVAGTAPFLVEKKTGTVIVFGTTNTLEYYIEEYEKGKWVPADDGIWESKE